MTDKQIIDGVDVSGCCHQGKDNTCTCPNYKKECGRNPNCHYKIMQRQTKKLDKFYKRELEIKQKLFRKEQECEELKTLKDETYFKLKEEYIQQLDQLKAENDELKKQLIILDDEDMVVEITVKQFEEYKKLKQTLTEIKEIMKKHCRKCKKHKFYYFQLCCTCKYTDILQKISECEGNDE